MSDIDDAQIKAEINGIMKGVRTIMQKIDALAPKKESEAQQTEGDKKKSDSSDNDTTEGD